MTPSGPVVELRGVSKTFGEGPGAVQALDQALTELEALDPRQSAILEQHYFGGLSLDDIAGAMSVSVRTIKRDLRAARAWLASQLAPEAS